MNVLKVTPYFSQESGDYLSQQMLEFSTSRPTDARTDVAPRSTVGVNQRWATVYKKNSECCDTPEQVTKFDIVHTIQYTDLDGNARATTHQYSTIITTPVYDTSYLDPVSFTPRVNKVLDVLVPSSGKIVDQKVVDNSPTAVPTKAKCHYAVFALHVTHEDLQPEDYVAPTDKPAETPTQSKS